MKRFSAPTSINPVFIVGLICFTTTNCESISFLISPAFSGLDNSKTVMSMLFPSVPFILNFVPLEIASFDVNFAILLAWSSAVKVNPPAVNFAPTSAPVMADVTGVAGVVTTGVFVTTGVTVLLPQPESTSVPTMALAQRTGVRRFFRMKRV